jgi:hypothetical protein
MRGIKATKLLIAPLLAAPMLVAGFAFSGSPAFAGGVTISCTTITGNASSTIVASNCTGGNTGGSSQPINGTALATGGTITWVSGSTTTIAAPKLKSTSAKKCPVAGSTADKVSGKVTGDTGDGIKIPGKVKGAVCIDPSGNVTALKPFKLT